MASKLDDLMAIAEDYARLYDDDRMSEAELSLRGAVREALRDALKASVEDAERWTLFTKTASLVFDCSPHWNAVMRFPLFNHDDQTITALVDRWAKVYEETKRDAARKP
jgi:hypothetical protein